MTHVLTTRVQLCQAVFEFAKESGYVVRPSCSYVSDTWLPMV